MKDVGEPCAGERHARFDGRALETEQSRQPNMAALGKPRDLSPDLPTTRHRASARPYHSLGSQLSDWKTWGALRPAACALFVSNRTSVVSPKLMMVTVVPFAGVGVDPSPTDSGHRRGKVVEEAMTQEVAAAAWGPADQRGFHRGGPDLRGDPTRLNVSSRQSTMCCEDSIGEATWQWSSAPSSAVKRWNVLWQVRASNSSSSLFVVPQARLGGWLESSWSQA